MFQISIEKNKASFSEFGFGRISKCDKNCFRIWDFPENIPRSFKWPAFIIRTTNNQSNLNETQKFNIIKYIEFRQSLTYSGFWLISFYFNPEKIAPLARIKLLNSLPNIPNAIKKQAPFVKKIGVLNFFENMAQLHEWKTNINITDENSWNMDETGFPIGVRKSQFVVFTHKIRKIRYGES